VQRLLLCDILEAQEVPEVCCPFVILVLPYTARKCQGATSGAWIRVPVSALPNAKHPRGCSPDFCAIWALEVLETLSGEHITPCHPATPPACEIRGRRLMHVQRFLTESGTTLHTAFPLISAKKIVGGIQPHHQSKQHPVEPHHMLFTGPRASQIHTSGCNVMYIITTQYA
jgi:hypothetical protein